MQLLLKAQADNTLFGISYFNSYFAHQILVLPKIETQRLFVYILPDRYDHFLFVLWFEKA
jgi:hypothetical protein